MNGNYLKKILNLLRKGYLDYCISSNYDEDYAKYFPSLSARDVFKLSVHYPDSRYQTLVEILRKKFKLGNIILGDGCEDLIVRICQVIEDKNWKVGVVTPTFYRITDMLETYTLIPYKNLENWNYRNLDAVWIINPNPLSGWILPKEVINTLVKDNPKTMFVVDETAIFFLQDWKKVSLLGNCNKTSNLIVLTSFSKFFGLSGLRVGFAAGNKNLLFEVNLRRLTFPISNLTSYIVEKVIDKDDFLKRIRNKINKNKKEVEMILSKNPNIETKPSDTNCVFCRLRNGQNLYKKLLEVGVIGLDLDSQLGIEEKGLVRLTIHSSRKRHNTLVDRLKKLGSQV